MELLVVISIIVLVMALAIPGLNTFLKGQRLEQSGRVVQTAFSNARQAAVTSHIPHRIVIFRKPEDNTPGAKMIYGIRVYKDGVKYEGEAQLLPRTIRIVTTPNTGIHIFDREPDVNDSRLDSRRNPGKVEYRKDGTVFFQLPYRDQKTIPDGFGQFGNIYDLNNRVNGVTRNFPADIILEQEGVNRRCFLDIVPNTGRVNFRVLPLTD
jgi:Tfp pilus assembly protein FimT